MRSAARELSEKASPRLHLVRHGQSTWNIEGRLQGQTDEAELTELGRQQSRRVAEFLAPIRPARSADL